MSWREFMYLLSGLNSETPLGAVVSIRAETDPEMIKNFNPQQKKIYTEYRRKAAMQKPKQDVENAIEMFRKTFIQLAGGSNEEA